MRKVILFDLDGSLLPQDQELFTKAYFKEIAKKMSTYGYDSNKIISDIWLGTKNMIKNDGKRTNEEVFWDTFYSIYGEKAIDDRPKFDSFYENEFDNVKKYLGFDNSCSEIIQKLKNDEFTLILATNPLFPMIAQVKRLNWSGVDEKYFSYITSYENSSFCKPNLMYYKEILSKNEIDASNCIMVGNDVDEDMICEELGMEVFLLTNCLLNKNNKDISKYSKGTLLDFYNNLSKKNK